MLSSWLGMHLNHQKGCSSYKNIFETSGEMIAFSKGIARSRKGKNIHLARKGEKLFCSVSLQSKDLQLKQVSESLEDAWKHKQMLDYSFCQRWVKLKTQTAIS